MGEGALAPARITPPTWVMPGIKPRPQSSIGARAVSPTSVICAVEMVLRVQQEDDSGRHNSSLAERFPTDWFSRARPST